MGARGPISEFVGPFAEQQTPTLGPQISPSFG